MYYYYKYNLYIHNIYNLLETWYLCCSIIWFFKSLNSFWSNNPSPFWSYCIIIFCADNLPSLFAFKSPRFDYAIIYLSYYFFVVLIPKLKYNKYNNSNIYIYITTVFLILQIHFYLIDHHHLDHIDILDFVLPVLLHYMLQIIYHHHQYQFVHIIYI